MCAFSSVFHLLLLGLLRARLERILAMCFKSFWTGAILALQPDMIAGIKSKFVTPNYYLISDLEGHDYALHNV